MTEKPYLVTGKRQYIQQRQLSTNVPFVADILKHRSLSIVGLEKNTGKTVCLNYVLGRLNEMGIRTAITSIGVDGEQTDSVYATAKPEITLYEGMRFITSEKHYLQRQLISQIIAVDEQRTSLGHLVTADVLHQGKVLLSGAAATEKLKRQIADCIADGISLTVIDGALSRLSLASPTVTDSMILATGAAVSPNLQQLISKTKFYYKLINLEEIDSQLQIRLEPLNSGLWAVDDDGKEHDLGIASAFLLGTKEINLFAFGNTLYAAGAVSDRLLKQLSAQTTGKGITLIVRDFTKLFITQEAYANFVRKGGNILVLRKSKLIAICLNPTSPQGFLLDSERACGALSEALGIPVYDVMKVPEA